MVERFVIAYSLEGLSKLLLSEVNTQSIVILFLHVTLEPKYL
jgi:hypothetical protein